MKIGTQNYMDQLQQKKFNKKIGIMCLLLWKSPHCEGKKKSTIIIFKKYDPISPQIKGGILHFTTPPPITSPIWLKPFVHDYQQTYFTNLNKKN
jgi:hypothetical protein